MVLDVVLESRRAWTVEPGPLRQHIARTQDDVDGLRRPVRPPRTGARPPSEAEGGVGREDPGQGTARSAAVAFHSG